VPAKNYRVLHMIPTILLDLQIADIDLGNFQKQWTHNELRADTSNKRG